MKRTLIVCVIFVFSLCGATLNALSQERGGKVKKIPGKSRSASVKTVSEGELYENGLMGYISSVADQPSSGYGSGVSFYVAVYPILPQPIDHFQIGLAGTWITPLNADDQDVPLCPPGTYARDNWPRRKPTYKSVFQTIEGGLGIWGSTQIRAGYNPPKFQIVAVPDCYTGNYIISPGWSNTCVAANENDMGLAQLSNHILIPPDGFTFQNKPHGELFGYAWMALPLLDAKTGPPPTGNQHWTLFLSLANFKGPIAFVIPETFSKISKDYTYDYGRGLDAQPGAAGGGDQEFNTVPYFEVKDDRGITYSKIPEFIYPVDENGQTVLMQDRCFYSSKAIADSLLIWRNGGPACSGRFNTSPDACHLAKVKAFPIRFDQTSSRTPLKGIDKVVQTTVMDSFAFGLQWKNSPISPQGVFPQYYMETDSGRVAVPESEVPGELREKQFAPAVNRGTYISPDSGVWVNTGPVKGPYYTYLADGSKVTYYWYRFIDQPSLQQYRNIWTIEMREKLQSIVEEIQKNWGPHQDYMPPPTNGKSLVSIDPGMLVTPPKGLEIGYVPIVTHQEAVKLK